MFFKFMIFLGLLIKILTLKTKSYEKNSTCRKREKEKCFVSTFEIF